MFASCIADSNARRGGRDKDGGASVGGDADTDGEGETDANSDCSELAKFVYLVDSDNSFYRFYPPDKQFELVGRINCRAGGGTPFSMSVARDGTAYVLHSGLLGGCSGIFPVSIVDATCGLRTGFTCGTQGFDTFGMGFVTQSKGSIAEDLFIGSTSRLATLDTGDWSVAVIGPLNGNPEFTGNALGELWGFFPSTQTPKVAQLDGNTGQLTTQWPLPGLSNDASAWAFAFWGGSFYIFYQAGFDASTNVYKVTDGVMESYMMNTGTRIVGAGVSTCAPTVPIV